MRSSPTGLPTTFAPAAAGLPSLWARAVAQVELWTKRAEERDNLFYLTDRQLGDMGFTREEAETEARKPFWRA